MNSIKCLTVSYILHIYFTSDACYDPPVVEHASHNGSKEYYLAGELLVYSCDFGYYRGNSIPLLMCQQIGLSAAWGNFKMSCSRKIAFCFYTPIMLVMP